MSAEFINDQWRLPNAWNGSESNVNKQSNYSMDFDGTSGVYIIAGDNSSLGEGYTGYTISAWAKTPTSWESDYNAILTKKFSFYFGLNQNHYLVLNPGSGTAFRGYEVTSTTVLNLDTWYHFLVTADGTNVKLYINGSLDKTQAETNTAQNPNTTYAPYIGAYSNSGDFDTWKGQLDAICFFDYALSSSQVTTLYGSSSTGIGNPMSLSPKPVAYYPLGDQDAFNGSSYLTPNVSLKDFVFDFVPNDNISFGNAIGNLIGDNYTGGFTISFWMNPDVTSGEDGIFNFSTNEMSLVLRSNSIRLYNNGQKASIIYTNPNNEWSNCVLSFLPSGSVFYLNGVSVANWTYTDLDLNGLDFSIGWYATTNYAYDGKLTNFQIWNTNLSSTEAETLYNNGSLYTGTQPQNSNLIAWWKLNASDTYDGTNWTIKDHAGSNDGTSSGMTQANLVQSDLSFTSGYSPYALDFDGVNDYITISGASNLNISGDLTMSMWFKANSFTNYEYIFRLGSGTTINGDRMIGFKNSKISTNTYADTSGAYDVLGNTTLSTGVWYHVAIVYSSNTVIIYLNGNADSSSIPTTMGTISYVNTTIAQSYNSNYFDGSISNCSIWNSSLTSAQISEIYSEGIPQNLLNHSAVSSLVSWWQLGSNSSFNTNWTVLDEKGSNNGTSTNMGEDAIVDGVNTYGGGTSSGMGGDEVIGDAPYSTANALSVNMDVEDRVTDTPS